jgi:hypothetical protein
MNFVVLQNHFHSCNMLQLSAERSRTFTRFTTFFRFFFGSGTTSASAHQETNNWRYQFNISAADVLTFSNVYQGVSFDVAMVRPRVSEKPPGK